MAKFNLEKGDKVIARTPSMGDVRNGTYIKTGGHESYGSPLTVTKTFSHGVRTKEVGYVHNNNIIGKETN